MGLRTSLQKEKEALVQVRVDLQVDNTDVRTSIYSKLDKLHEDLAVKSRIMDEIVARTTKVQVQVQAAKLTQANKETKELQSE